ncbi:MULTISPECIES: nitroreductase family protein [unclassified Neisseria]|uniref:nitroreductase family protein n=1 Tax=unclassified Neisseria TaxID=2623750 RepID=UPI0026656842|nr:MULTISPECIES: nitroreductase family protein [unclassified Neisseria]MDO1509342.1 nitroreductase family protein [Neisseria sp. MVDL19-042950]MDO1515379.1 nitroreductase family protein [Neisseria sp. MVDL18-041461]MDO1562739.1 nitroreductase family protein [Neisseria sp. MVDL20-010259]
MEKPMMLADMLNHRRAVRHYDADKKVDSEKVRECLRLAQLAPSSSNMQLYEFYHITDPETLKQLAVACLSQGAATTAPQMVVFVTRQDLYRERARTVLDFERGNLNRNSPPEKVPGRLKKSEFYYGKLLPFIYARCFGLLGLLRKILTLSASLFRPVVVDVSEADVRTVVHKSCGLAAQTFMLAMAEQGYDTCPMEGLDSRMAKRILKLPRGAEINMIVACGIRKEGRGIWGERFRLPFEDVYREI